MNNQMCECIDDKDFLIMTLILNDGQCQKLVQITKENGVCCGIIMLGRGTVKSIALNILGIRSQKKILVNILLEKSKAEAMLDILTDGLQLNRQGHGIVYTSPVVTAGQILNDKQANRKESKVSEEDSMFKKLTVIVNRGMAEEVIDIARKAGAKGGTILHGRGTGSEFAEKLFGMEIEPEKELVIILMPSELIEKTVKDLNDELKLDAAGNGILFVEPITDVRGLLEA